MNEKDISEAKNKIQTTWINKMKSRSDLYFRYYRNLKLGDIFTKELEKENPKLPCKFLSDIQQNNTEEEKNIKKELAKEKVKAEIKLLTVRYQRQLSYIKNIDQEMNEFIKANYPSSVSEHLITMWQKECKHKGDKTAEKFLAKEQWYKENWLSEKEENVMITEHQNRGRGQDRQPFRRNQRYNRNRSTSRTHRPRNYRQPYDRNNDFRNADNFQNNLQELEEIQPNPSESSNNASTETLVEILESMSNSEISTEITNENTDEETDDENPFLLQRPSQ